MSIEHAKHETAQHKKHKPLLNNNLQHATSTKAAN